ncbi:hypothetical protein [Parascardovia denticolens]|uniref:hypothetical protein n=1 Tax=Parascardovia denticolens TaxID=78258 RepID=UPI00248E126E|nr:hypothetical protein [Parascardovia denticolens]
MPRQSSQRRAADRSGALNRSLWTKSLWTRSLCAFGAFMLLIGSAACEAPSPAKTTTAEIGVFTPSSPISVEAVTSNRPLNNWDNFTTDLDKALNQENGGKDRRKVEVSTHRSSNLKDQSASVDSYLAKTKEAPSSAARKILILSPAYRPDQVAQQFSPMAALAPSGVSSAKTTENSQEDKESAAALTSSLRQARKDGFTVLLLGDSSALSGFKADQTVTLLTAYQIGRAQARGLASKLALAKASRTNRQSVEILLPLLEDNRFTRDLFSGIWSVLGPYYRSGAIYSPSGLLTASSGAKDWRTVTVNAGNKQTIAQALKDRLRPAAGSSAHVRINGVLAANDLLCQGAIEGLNEAGYTGSSADINPQISISGVITNLSGGTTVRRKPVPDPATRADERTEVADYPHWPLIVGYGTYPLNLPHLVDGKQWSTAMVDRKAFIARLSAYCLGLARGTVSPSSRLFSPTLLTISASNIKTGLVNAGYLSASQAGL